MVSLGTVSRPSASGLRSPLVWVATAIGITLLNLPALVRPAPPSDACGQVVPVMGPFVRFQNCDAHVFNLIALDWSQLFAPAGETRLGRPVYLAAGWITDRLISLVTFGNVDPTSAVPPDYTAAEVGFILLNIVILTTAVLLAWRFVVPAGGRASAASTTAPTGRSAWGPFVLLGVLVAVNPVTKAFLWTSHTQMFTMLVPAVALLAAAWAVSRQPSTARVFVVGLLIGLGILAYAAMTIVAVAVAAGFLTRRLWSPAASVLVGSAVLPIMWVGFVVIERGSYYSVETEKFRQFVWVGDALSDGSLVPTLRGNFDALVRTFGDGQTVLALLILATLAIVLGFVVLLRGTAPETSATPRAVAFLITMAAQIAFLFLMGFYQTRLSWGLIITLAIGLSAVAVSAIGQLSGRLRRLMNAGFVTVAIGWYAIWVAIPIPWS